MRPMKKTATLVLAIIATLGPAGCRQGKPGFLKELVPATGRVTAKGKPIVGVTVRFVPEITSQGGRDAMGLTDENGSYELSTLVPRVSPTDTKGVIPGNYIVTIDRIEIPVGGDFPIGSPELKALLDKRAKQPVPARYADPSTSPLKAKVAMPKAENNFDL